MSAFVYNNFILRVVNWKQYHNMKHQLSQYGQRVAAIATSSIIIQTLMEIQEIIVFITYIAGMLESYIINIDNNSC